MAYTKNMTVGKPFPIIFGYFIPVLCSTIFQQLYSMVDTIIVGKGIDDMALAAVGATGAITFFIFGFIMGLGNGMAVLMSQAFGAGDYNKLRKTITMGFISCGTVAIVVMLLSLVVIKPVLVMLNTSPVILEDALLYISIIIVGIPLTLVYNCLSAILSALGDSRTPLIAVIISSIINVVLDIVFIMGLGMGVEGAAIATLIAQMLSGIFCFIKLCKIPYVHLKKEDWRLDFSLIWRQFRIGVPVAFMNSVTAVGCLLLQYFVNMFGVNYTAAYTACSKISQFMTIPGTAVGAAMSVFAGQNLGAGKIDRIGEGIKCSTKITLVMTAFTSALLLFVPRAMASILLSDPAIIELSIDFLRICGVMGWSIAMLFVVRNALQGMGFTVVPMISGFLELVARVAMILTFASSLGYTAVAFAETSAWFSALVLNGIFLFIKLRKLREKRDE